MTQLERYEWCDFWWEEANNHDKRRVLLIGDSITKAYRPYVNELLRGNVYVDMLATSKAIDNPSFLQEIDYIINHRKDFQYEVIHMNNGLHGWHLSIEDYEINYNRVIQHLLQYICPAKIVVALTTPKTKEGDPTQYDSELNNKVIERNNAVERIAGTYNLIINDLYLHMNGMIKYRDVDGYHYNTEGQRAQAEIVAPIIGSLIT